MHYRWSRKKYFVKNILTNIQTKRGWFCSVELSYSLKVFITFKIFYVFNIIPFIIKQGLKEFRYCVSGSGGLKSSIFDIQKMTLHQIGYNFPKSPLTDTKISLPTLTYIVWRELKLVILNTMTTTNGKTFLTCNCNWVFDNLNIPKSKQYFPLILFNLS